MIIKVKFCWYDMWVGMYYSREKHALYICLIPTVVIVIGKKPKEHFMFKYLDKLIDDYNFDISYIPDDEVVHKINITKTDKTICDIKCINVDVTTQWRWVTCNKCLKFKYTQG